MIFRPQLNIQSYEDWAGYGVGRTNRKDYNSYVNAQKANYNAALEAWNAQQQKEAARRIAAQQRKSQREAEKKRAERDRELKRMYAKEQAAMREMREMMDKQLAAANAPVQQSPQSSGGGHSEYLNRLIAQQESMRKSFEEQLAKQKSMQEELIQKALDKQDASYSENIDAYIDKFMPHAERAMTQALTGRGLSGEIGANMPSLVSDLTSQAGLFAGQEKRADIDSLLGQYSTVGADLNSTRQANLGWLSNLLNNSTSQFQQSRSLSHDASQRAADRRVQLMGQRLSHMDNLFNSFNNMYSRGGLFS